MAEDIPRPINDSLLLNKIKKTNSISYPIIYVLICDTIEGKELPEAFTPTDVVKKILRQTKGEIFIAPRYAREIFQTLQMLGYLGAPMIMNKKKVYIPYKYFRCEDIYKISLERIKELEKTIGDVK